ncbi:MAG: hypothetical protein FWE40_08545 [Oscillospiraceae bacterium]|nr:hypothetical protein [Oscillospiraceae bacterium]
MDVIRQISESITPALEWAMQNPSTVVSAASVTFNLGKVCAKAYNNIMGIREQFTVKKFDRFQDQLQNSSISQETLNEWIQKSPEERDEIAEQLVIAIDRVDKEIKASYIAKIFVALLEEKIAYDQFDDMLKIIDDWYSSDSTLLKEINAAEQGDKNGTAYSIGLIMARKHRLNSMGLLDIVEMPTTTPPLMMEKFQLSTYGKILSELLETESTIVENYKDRALSAQISFICRSVVEIATKWPVQE